MSFIAVLVAAALGLFSHPLAPSFAAHTGAKQFCTSPGPRDYSAPLADLPPVRSIRPGPKAHPGLGNLPFGPRTVEMYVVTEGPVVVRPDRYGVAFWDVGFMGNKPETNPKLNWNVTAQLISLDPSGGSVEEVAHGHIRIGRINNAYQPSLTVPVPDLPGPYRFDVQISDANGTRLGAYSEYLRVVEPAVKVRLGINDRRYLPGQTLATRPEELGTAWISYGAHFEVQRQSSGGWRRYGPLNPRDWNLWLGSTGPGGAGRCSYLPVPADTPVGRYRIVKTVGVTTGGKYARGLTLIAPFFVSSPKKVS